MLTQFDIFHLSVVIVCNLACLGRQIFTIAMKIMYLAKKTVSGEYEY